MGFGSLLVLEEAMYYLSLKWQFRFAFLLTAFSIALLTYSLSQQIPMSVTIIGFVTLAMGLSLAKRLYTAVRDIIDDSLSQVNGKSERCITEETKSLARHNMELAILNRFITPITPPYETAKVIKGCLEEFNELTNINVKISLFSDPIRIKEESCPECDKLAPYLLPICSKKLTFGYLGIDDTFLDKGDWRFLETLAHSAGIIMQNEILLRTNQEKHAVLKTVIESMYDAIIWFDDEGKAIYANQRLIALFEVQHKKLRGLPEEFLFNLISNMWLEQSPDSLESIRKNYGRYRFKIRRSDGQELFLIVSAFPVSTEIDTVLGKGYIFRDITKEQEVEKLKSDLISLVSHEFKTPITSIKGSVETLLRKDAVWDKEFELELLDGIHEDIGHIQVLVNDWLDLSKIESGAISLNREPTRPFLVADNAIKKMPKHFSNGVTINNNVLKDLPLIYADRVRLEQVIANLLTNAIRYNDRSPHVEITAKSDEEYIYISVEDNGIGIKDADLNKVFERLSNIDACGQRRCGGTGLGLAICKGIIQAHGGKIQVESTKDIGSIFTISIPRYHYSSGGDYEEI